MLKVYEITGANGLPYKVQLSPEAANKFGAVEVKGNEKAEPVEPTPQEVEPTPQKKAGPRGKTAANISQ